MIFIDKLTYVARRINYDYLFIYYKGNLFIKKLWNGQILNYVNIVSNKHQSYKYKLVIFPHLYEISFQNLCIFVNGKNFSQRFEAYMTDTDIKFPAFSETKNTIMM